MVTKVLLLLLMCFNPISPEPDGIPNELKEWEHLRVRQEGGNIYECKNIIVKDADTISADIYITEFQVVLLKRDIRASDFDACEVSRRRDSVIITDEELILGKKAKLLLIDLLKTHKLYVCPEGHDVYGRVLGHLYLDTQVYDDRESKIMTKYISLEVVIKHFKYDRSQL